MMSKLEEIEASVTDGAQEIDIVITREHVLTGNWQALYDEMRDFRAACGDAHVKAILGDRRSEDAAQCRQGLDGLHDGRRRFHQDLDRQGRRQRHAARSRSPCCAMIRDYHERTGFKVGYKPAGGISAAKDVLNYQFLMKEELGREWLEPDLFRVGASSLLADIERQLEHHVTGRYSAFNRHPVG